MNALPKYVVSDTLGNGSWNPTTVLGGDPLVSVVSLRNRPGGELQIHGSSRLASALLAAGLVDTLRLAVAPVIIGQGRRLLRQPSTDAGLRLVKHEATPTGLLVLEYETTGAAPLANYEGSPALP